MKKYIASLFALLLLHCPLSWALADQFSCSICIRDTQPLSTTETSATGIPLDSAWKVSVYNFARKNSVHPAWGIAHSERDYQIAQLIAKNESITMDDDVLFAAAFLHDLGGLQAFALSGVDHAQRSVVVIEPLLEVWGFPMQKWTGLKEMILGHTYYGPKPASKSATAFRDADILDFLGTIGVARMLSVTLETGFSDGTLRPVVSTLDTFAQTMASKCSLKACEKIASPRQKEMRDFLDKLNAYSFGGKAL